MFFTANVIVLSAAMAVGAAIMVTEKAAKARALFMGGFQSGVEEKGSEEVEAERGNDKDSCEDEACLDDAIR
jgi:hypothetical protein